MKILGDDQNLTWQPDKIQEDVSLSLDVLVKAVESSLNYMDSCATGSVFINSSHDTFNRNDARPPVCELDPMETEEPTKMAVDNSQVSSIQSTTERDVVQTFDRLLQGVESILNLPPDHNFPQEFVRHFDEAVQNTFSRNLFDDVHLPECSYDENLTTDGASCVVRSDCPMTEGAVGNNMADIHEGTNPNGSNIEENIFPRLSADLMELDAGDLIDLDASDESDEEMMSSLLVLTGDLADAELTPEELLSFVIPLMTESVGDQENEMDEMENNDILQRMVEFFREMEIMQRMEDQFSLGTGDHSERNEPNL